MMYIMMKSFIAVLLVTLFAPMVITNVADFMEFDEQSVVMKPEAMQTIENFLLVDEQEQGRWWEWWESTPILGTILSTLREFIGFLYELLLSNPLEALVYFTPAIAYPLGVIVYLVNFMVILGVIIGIRQIGSG